MKKKDASKLKLNPGRIVAIFAILFVVFEVIFYLSIQGGMSGKLWPLDKSFYFYTPALLAASFIFGYLSLAQTYYEVDNKKLTHYKMGKITEYSWANIVYIDEEFSEKKKTLLFYTKDGKEHVLWFDKEGIIFKTALEKCTLVDKEEFQRRYTNKRM